MFRPFFISVLIAVIVLNCHTVSEAGVQTLKERLAVSQAEVETSLSREWLVIALDEGESIEFWDIHLQGEDEASLLVGLNSEFIFVAALSGHVKSRNKSLLPGKVLLFRHLGSVPDRLMAYSAKELKTVFESYGRDDLANLLEEVAQKQRCKIFWGLLRPTKVNVGSPLPKNIEQLRQNYSTLPELIEIKRGIDDVKKLPQAVAEIFLTGAYAKNATVVAALLSPDAFRASAQKGRFKMDREFIAKKLVLQSWATGYEPHSLKKTDQPFQFSFMSNGKTYLIDLTVFDSTVFVQKVYGLGDES